MPFKPFNIGKYYFTDLLGKGGMAEVYRVQVHGASGFYKEFAVKRILAAHWTDLEFIRLFEREARLTSLLTHANIVQVYDFFKAQGGYMLVMEYVHGRNLAQVRDKAIAVRAPFPTELAVYLAAEVCKGLEYAAAKVDPDTGVPLNIVHRDITPHNIMLSFEGAVKIVDFGIAKAKDRANLTEIGTLRGKVAYMSPEQALGQALDQRSDLFATCLVLLELLTGKQLFKGPNELAILSMVQECEIPRPSELSPAIPEALEAILLNGLQKKPEDRYPAVSALRRELQGFLHENYPGVGQSDLAEFMGSMFTEEMTSSIARESEEDSTPISADEGRQLLSELDRLQETGIGGRVDHPPATSARLPTRAAPPPVPAPREPSGSGHGATVLLGAAVVLLATGSLLYYAQRARSPRPADVAEKAETSEAATTCLVKIESIPEGASILIDRREAGSTPARLPVTCGAPVEVTLSRDGYKPLSRSVTFSDRANQLNLTLTKIAEEAASPAQPPAEPEKGREPALARDSETDKEELTEGEYDTWLAEVSRSKESKASLAKRFHEQGVTSFKDGRYREAIENFRKSRMLQDDFLPSWLFEIQALDKIGRKEEARQTAQRLLARRPDLKSLPTLKGYVDGDE